MFNPEAPPELTVTRWFNVTQPITLASLKGRVVVLLAFQMLCPGCVSHALPQARKLAGQFSSKEVAVIGLHAVFEHHAAMPPDALAAFIAEYGWDFPIGVDAYDTPDDPGIPRTMTAYEMRGTPTILIFDRQGRLRRHYFGQVDDMRLAAEIMAMSIEDRDAPREASVAIERKLHATLLDPHAHHDHQHGDDCGCGHDHGDHGHAHDHAHDHGHVHGPDCGHDHSHDHAPEPAAAKPKAKGKAKR